MINRKVRMFAGGSLLAVSLSAGAITEVVTILQAHWTQTNGDLVFYGDVAGPCVNNTSTIYLVRKSLPNFTEMKDSLMLAEAKGWETDLVVASCDLNQNVVTFAKVCKNPDYC
ncbi:MAG: hypothetical protein MN733_13785 [Nitrososphaera sp.]|nr:hypothetical protein [Nitrososphaera sp.]